MDGKFLSYSFLFIIHYSIPVADYIVLPTIAYNVQPTSQPSKSKMNVKTQMTQSMINVTIPIPPFFFIIRYSFLWNLPAWLLSLVPTSVDYSAQSGLSWKLLIVFFCSENFFPLLSHLKLGYYKVFFCELSVLWMINW